MASHLRAEATWRTHQLIEYVSVGTYFNDHAKLWLSGPGSSPGTPPVYGNGPFAADPEFANSSDCAATEATTVGEVGKGECYFVDSKASNNWIALRVRNASHNYVYVESFGAKAMATPTGGTGNGTGIFKCLEGDLCQNELYDYGPITSDYPNFPVMTDERWCLVNSFKTLSEETKAALHAELKEAYCSTRRLGVDRMECGEGKA